MSADLRLQLCEVGADFYRRGWSLATSSNYSARKSDEIWATASGRDKGSLDLEDFIRIDMFGSVTKQYRKKDKPSAETDLHLAVYHTFPDAACVLHTHSVNGTLLSDHFLSHGKIVLYGMEMLKAFPGNDSHEVTEELPVYANTQDIADLARKIAADLKARPETKAFLMAGHGLYTWGHNVAAARRRIEALEFLLELEYKRILLEAK